MDQPPHFLYYAMFELMQHTTLIYLCSSIWEAQPMMPKLNIILFFLKYLRGNSKASLRLLISNAFVFSSLSTSWNNQLQQQSRCLYHIPTTPTSMNTFIIIIQQRPPPWTRRQGVAPHHLSACIDQTMSSARPPGQHLWGCRSTKSMRTNEK